MRFAVTQDEIEKQAGTSRNSWHLASPQPPHLRLLQEELGDVLVGSMPKTLTNSAYLPGKRADDREHSKGNITAVAKRRKTKVSGLR